MLILRRFFFKETHQKYATIPLGRSPPANLQKMVVFRGNHTLDQGTQPGFPVHVFCSYPKRWIRPLPGLRTVHEALLFQQEAKEGKHTARTRKRASLGFFLGKTMVPRFSLQSSDFLSKKEEVHGSCLFGKGWWYRLVHQRDSKFFATKSRSHAFRKKPGPKYFCQTIIVM